MTAVADEATIAEVAGALRDAEADREPIRPLTDSCPSLTVADAYAIQAQNTERRIAAGAKLVGHKIGLTSLAMQEMLGVDEPDYGALFDDISLASGSSVLRRDLIAPRVEPEIAFVLGRALGPGGVTADDVLDATREVRPALEIIDSRIADWKIGLVDTVADNASCARMVLAADGVAPGDLDLASLAVDLKVDGMAVAQGTGEAVLGHPAEAVAWLANVLAGFGVSLDAGQVVLPGSCTAAVELSAGSHVLADFGPLGTVEVSCT